MSESELELRTLAANMALSMYINEPCRICGNPITKEDVKDCIFTGYSVDNKARTAHFDCWTAMLGEFGTAENVVAYLTKREQKAQP